MSVDTALDMSVLTELDFEHALPCESVGHHLSPGDEPASWHVKVKCPDCGDTLEYVMCEPCREWKMNAVISCGECPRVGWYTDYIIFLVPITPK